MVGPIIRLEDLVKRYRGAEKNAVDNIPFEVSPGEFFALVGPNGAGKTPISILTTAGKVLATPFGGSDGPVTRTDGHEPKEEA